MRCHSLQALWGPSPPQHHVRAVLLVDDPVSLWTGATNGVIVLWRLMSEIWPVSLLCGHTAEIAALEACNPDDACEPTEHISSSSYASTIRTKFDTDYYNKSGRAVISACIDGGVCTWDALTGRCRRRRHLPPWVGQPCAVSALPKSPRYVIIACNGTHVSLRHADAATKNTESGPESTPAGSGEKAGRGSGIKNSLVIVDTATLSVLHVLNNCALSVGSIAAMVVVPEHASKFHPTYSVTVCDLLGRLKVCSGVSVDQGKPGLGGPKGDMLEEANSEQNDCVGGMSSLSEVAEALSFSPDGLLLLLVLQSKWVIRSVSDGGVVAESAGIGAMQHGLKELAGLSECAGGCFLHGSGSKFLVWNTQGAAVLHSLSDIHEKTLGVEVLAYIPPTSHSHTTTVNYHFVQLGNLLLRSESEKSDAVEDVLMLEPQVTLWLTQRAPLWSAKLSVGMPLHDEEDKSHSTGQEELGNNLEEALLLGQAGLWADWFEVSGSKVDVSFSEASPQDNARTKPRASHPRVMESETFVTASMLLSGSFSVQSTLVYGFASGVIQLLELQVVNTMNSTGDKVNGGDEVQAVQNLFGHTGAILCLAEHSLPPLSEAAQGDRVLISGSMDCTVCIWNLRKGGELLAVLHHHVAPVRQLILPPHGTQAPWSHCFISVSDDHCVAVSSLETLSVERLFPGHAGTVKTVIWDCVRGFLACLCTSSGDQPVVTDQVYIWDLHSGARERILRGTPAHSMIATFSSRFRKSADANSIFSGSSTSASALLAPTEELPNRPRPSRRPLKPSESISSITTVKSSPVSNPTIVSSRPLVHKQPIRGASPLPGVATLQFDLFALMAPDLGSTSTSGEKESRALVAGSEESQIAAVLERVPGVEHSEDKVTSSSKEDSWLGTVQGRLLQTSLAFLHLWGVDQELDSSLLEELLVSKPQHIKVGSGLAGDRGAMTLSLPNQRATLELWKKSPEFCALRSLTNVALAQHLLHLSKPANLACSALAGFYSRSLAEKLPGSVNPCLEVYACFWQDPSEHVRMAARSLFHCAASRAIPSFLQLDMSTNRPSPHFENPPKSESESSSTYLRHSNSNGLSDTGAIAHITDWIQSYDGENWTATIGGTNQDARAARIIVSAALALWYPSLVQPEVAPTVAPMLLNLVRATHDRHSATAADVLAEGMESTWQMWIGAEIPQLIADVFFLIECLSGVGAPRPTSGQPLRAVPSATMAPAVAMAIRESLTGNLLTSLALADVPAFLDVVKSQLATFAPNSPVHLVGLMALIRLVRSHPKALIFYLDQLTALVMQTMDTGNLVLRKQCSQTAMGVLQEMVRMFPMVALHRGSTPSNAKLAVGDGVGDIRSLTIHVYDLNSATKLKVLDASGPPGHPALLASNKTSATAGGISALSFSPDGEGLVAFSQQGLTIRWWSLGAAWWDRLSRTLVPIQCTKLVLVPPWAGFSPRSSSSSMMAFVYRSSEQLEQDEVSRRLSEDMSPRLAFHNVDLAFRLEWKPNKKVSLLHHGQELGIFQL
ncbi:unnamed protein product [Sphagnum troendelagicum]|uniref:WD repeat-containing protein 7 n=1 Tax=Sphagnum troendelagicum TaxID=128251 RepID=A0ABP0UWB3_9BRYO